MLKTRILDIKEHVFEWAGLTLYDDLYSVLTHKQENASKIFIKIVNEALRRYDQFYPVQLDYYLNAGMNYKTYKLPDNNFHRYLSGTITEDKIVLTPEQIYFIEGWLSVNAQWWRFDEISKVITFDQICQIRKISYFANHPIFVKYAPDGDITEDSYIYYVDVWEDEVFRVFLLYYLLRYIRNVNMSIEVPSNIQYFKNLDSILNDFKTDMDEFIETRSRIMRMWRK